MLRFQISLLTLVDLRQQALVLLAADSLKFSNSNLRCKAFNSNLTWVAFNSNLIWALAVETQLIHSVHLTLVVVAHSLRIRPHLVHSPRIRPHSAPLVKDLASQPPSRIKLRISLVH